MKASRGGARSWGGDYTGPPHSQGARVKKKFLSKANWFKKGRRKDNGNQKSTGYQGAKSLGSRRNGELQIKSVLFVEQSPRGELASRLREALRKMEQTLGFKVKVVERTGRSLGSQFPLGSLWDGAKCGRKDCVTCEQEGEELPQCTRTNLVYENICVGCNPGALRKGELEQIRSDVPTVYIGETSRSIYERSKEHYEGAKRGSTKNHMVKHRMMEHTGEQEPKFNMKVRGYYKTALARQVAEAVLIRRRGGEGAILNSKGEFNRSYIPRLQVEEEPEGAAEERTKIKESVNRILREQDGDWERGKTRELGSEAILGPKTSPMKRAKEQDEQTPENGRKRRRRRLKHGLVEEGWGEPQTPQGAGQPTQSREPTTSREQYSQAREPTSSREPRTVSRAPSREHALMQPRITGFLNPAPSPGEPMNEPTDRPITGNQVASSDQDPTAIRSLGCGSPCNEKDDSINQWDDEITFGTSMNIVKLKEGGSNEYLITTYSMSNEECGETKHECAIKCEESMGKTAPSVRNVSMRKPGTECGLRNATESHEPRKLEMIVRKSESENVPECEFKKGGRCIVHDCVGRKSTTTKKVWTKKRDGGYGWTTRQQTTYKCQYEGVTVSDRNLPDRGGGTQTISGRGGTNDVAKLGNISGISRVVYERVAANESESGKCREDYKDLD